MIAIVALDIVLGPLLLFAFLFYNRNSIRNQDQAFAATHGIFFDVFNNPSRSELIAASWQCVILARRATLSAITVVGSEGLRYMAFTVATAAFFAIHALVHPFKVETMNHMCVCLVVLCPAALSQGDGWSVCARDHFCDSHRILRGHSN